MMELRFEHSPKEVATMNTAELREAYLVEQLMSDERANLVYSHHDRLIIGGIKPLGKEVFLENFEELKAEFFLERRELGIINTGGSGKIIADGVEYQLEHLSCLYLGKGTKNVSFQSVDPQMPAFYYLLSSTAHAAWPNRLMTREETQPVELGDQLTSNKRMIYKYIHLDGIRSCQLVMGLTMLEAGSVWNSVPPHTHTRRTEVYFYFGLPENQRVFHFMGEPQELRSLVIKNHEAVISPPWSVHFGSGTSNYSFIWGMAGENQLYSDMDALQVKDLK